MSTFGILSDKRDCRAAASEEMPEPLFLKFLLVNTLGFLSDFFLANFIYVLPVSSRSSVNSKSRDFLLAEMHMSIGMYHVNALSPESDQHLQFDRVT